ncbi:MAG: hypothetical protein ACOX6P_05590 [Candidatus Merdivicinus sp.]|jgi:hypothetical protein
MSNQCGCGCSNQSSRRGCCQSSQDLQTLEETYSQPVETTTNYNCPQTLEESPCCCACQCGCHSCGCCPHCTPTPRRGWDVDYARDVATADSVSCTCNSVCPGTNCNDPDVPIYTCTGSNSRSRCRICCDQDGCCRIYPCSWRNKFWPEFCHPRWLCCRDLYNVRD